jgi:predicted nicotinamide N-methyase
MNIYENTNDRKNLLDVDHTIICHNTKALKASHPEVRRLKRVSAPQSAHGNKIWRSSFVLIDYLNTYPPEVEASILEVGCGWGLTGINLAKHYAANVTALDIDSTVEPFLELQALENKTDVTFRLGDFASLSAADLKPYDTVIGADICFWDDLVEPLCDFIKLSLSVGVNRIIIADPGRPPFWTLCDIAVEQLNGEVLTRRIDKPIKTEKFILSIENK